MKTKPSAPLAALRHHVSGAIARGEKQAVTCQPPAAGEAANTLNTLRVGYIGHPGQDVGTAAHAAESVKCMASVYDEETLQRIARVYGKDIKEAKERAAFIVRACNSHAAHEAVAIYAQSLVACMASAVAAKRTLSAHEMRDYAGELGRLLSAAKGMQSPAHDTASAFVAMVARMQTEDESGGMTSEDAIMTVNELITEARRVQGGAQ